jgi:hypothetical protein
MDHLSSFSVVKNHNGTFGAVCKVCCTTSVAYVRVKEELERWHAKHSCDSVDALPQLTQR